MGMFEVLATTVVNNSIRIWILSR